MSLPGGDPSFPVWRRNCPDCHSWPCGCVEVDEDGGVARLGNAVQSVPHKRPRATLVDPDPEKLREDVMKCACFRVR